MWSSRRPALRRLAFWTCWLLAAVPVTAALGGCGFQPLYSKEARRVADPVLATIKVAPIPDRIGVELAQALREELNPRNLAVEHRYVLTVAVQVLHNDVGITTLNTAAQSAVSVSANYYLTDVKTNTKAFTATSRSFSLYNILDDGYATQVALDDAQDRAVRDLGKEIMLQLAFFAQRQQSASKS